MTHLCFGANTPIFFCFFVMLAAGCDGSTVEAPPDGEVPLDAVTPPPDAEGRDGGAMLGSSGCVSPEVRCSLLCIDPATDPDHCGADDACEGGAVCEAGSACVAGACVFACPTGLLACDRTCVDPRASLTHCGATGACLGSEAGRSCGDGELCQGGACACEAGLLACVPGCIDPSRDGRHCGAIGDCMDANAGAACSADQVCRRGACEDAGAWTATAALDIADERTSQPRLAVATSGFAVASWTQFSGTTNNVWGATFDPVRARWSTATLLESEAGGASLPFVAVRANGDAAVLWDQQGSDRDTWLALYAASTGLWSAPVAVEADAGRVSRAGGVAWLSTGGLLAYWLDAGKPTVSVHDGATGAVSRSDALAMGLTGAATSGIDSAGGHAAALYRSTDGADQVIWSAFRNTGTGDWTVSELARGTAALGNAAARVADDGFTVALWRVGVTADRQELWTSNRETGGWTSPSRLDEVADGTANFASLDVTPTGDAMVVLRQAATCLGSAGSCANVRVRRFDRAGAGWGPAVDLESRDMAANFPQVSLAAGGDAVAVWYQTPTVGSSFRVWTRRFTASTGAWSPAVAHGLDDEAALLGVAGLADTGDLVVVWRQTQDGRHNIWARAFSVER